MRQSRNPKNITYEKAFNQILEFFQYDKDKALTWYMKPNSIFDGLSPYEMIKHGHGQKLMKHIRNGLLEKYGDPHRA